MSNFLGQEESVDVFQCPNCSHFNSSKAQACGKCSTTFSDGQKQSAIEKTKLETKRHNLKYYKNVLITGALMFLGGGSLTFINIYTVYTGNGGRFSMWLVALTLLGFGNILWGVRGWRAESKN